MLELNRLKSACNENIRRERLEDSSETSQKQKSKWFETRFIESDVEGTLLFQNALVLIEEKEYSLAEDLLRTLIERDSHLPQVIYWLMQLALRREQTELALKLSKKLAEEKKDFYSYFFLGNIYYQGKDDIRAVEAYQKALKSVQYDSLPLFEIYKNMGNISIKMRDLEAAEEFFHKAESIDAVSDTLAVNMGTLALQKSEIEKARQCFKKAIQLNKENDRAWAGLALINKVVADLELAKANAEYALDINPMNKVAIQIMIDSATDISSWNSVMKHLENYLEQDGFDAEISFALAKIFIQHEKWSSAAIELTRCEVLNPEIPQLRECQKLVRENL